MTQANTVGGWKHFCILPFETLFGFLALVGGLLALVHYGGTGGDAVSLLLPDWLNTGVQGLYATSGLALLVGLAKPRRDIEAAGLIILTASIAIRTVAVFTVLGFSDLSTLSFVFNTLIIVACFMRLNTIFKREVIVSVKP